MGYTKMPNGPLFDKTLSAKARGVLWTLSALPPDWDFNTAGFVTLFPDGRDSIYSALKELKVKGYINIKQDRGANSARFGKTMLTICGGTTLTAAKEPTPKVNKAPPKTKAKKKEPTLEELAAFDRWWKLYPKKQDKARSQKLFVQALKEVSEDVLTDGVKRYVAELQSKHTDAKYYKMPSTWLSKKCWQDEYEIPSLSVCGLPTYDEDCDF